MARAAPIPHKGPGRASTMKRGRQSPGGVGTAACAISKGDVIVFLRPCMVRTKTVHDPLASRGFGKLQCGRATSARKRYETLRAAGKRPVKKKPRGCGAHRSSFLDPVYRCQLRPGRGQIIRCGKIGPSCAPACRVFTDSFHSGWNVGAIPGRTSRPACSFTLVCRSGQPSNGVAAYPCPRRCSEFLPLSVQTSSRLVPRCTLPASRGRLRGVRETKQAQCQCLVAA